MKNNMYRIAVICAIFVFMVATRNAYAESDFSVSLRYGDSGAEVSKLQQFLVDQGFLKSSLVTGNFLSLTKKAVTDFQKNNGIESTGFFGPLSRAAANQKLVSTQTPKSTVSMVSVKSDSSTASLILSNSKKISWQTTNYPMNIGVDINLIRKISDNPVSYVFVEKIAKDIQNSGSFLWIPKSNQTGNDLYIEVTCSTTYKFTSECSFAGTPTKVF